MTILDSLRDYIIKCPHLKLFQDALLTVNVNYSKSDEAETYSINEGVTQPIKKMYINGDTERVFLFTFSSIEFYGSDVQNNIDNSGFYEKFVAWLEENTSNKILPIMGDRKKARKIEALTNGYPFSNTANGTTMFYQIQCKLTYFQPK